jgi:hypothetical protein
MNCRTGGESNLLDSGGSAARRSYRAHHLLAFWQHHRNRTRQSYQIVVEIKVVDCMVHWYANLIIEGAHEWTGQCYDGPLTLHQIIRQNWYLLNVRSWY